MYIALDYKLIVCGDSIAIVPTPFLAPSFYYTESHRKEMDDLREELRKLKEEKLDSKLKLLHNRSSEENLLTNGMFTCAIAR